MLLHSCCILIDYNRYLNGNDNYSLLICFFLMTALQQRYNRSLPIFIKFMRSPNDKRVNKLSSRISSGISNMHFCSSDLISVRDFVLRSIGYTSGISIKHFCIEFDIMTIKLCEINLIKPLER